MTASPLLTATPLDALVVGAGQAGLAMSWHLKRLGARFLVVDAGARVGDVWRSRYDSLQLFTPAEYDSLPGLPFPARSSTYPCKDQVADYLETYARVFQVPVQLGTRVVRLQQAATGFVAETTTGTIAARQVVVATGACGTPYAPLELAAALGPEVTQQHSSAYRRPADLPDGPVVVVGAGNSGVQIAVELAATGRPVLLSVGTRSLAVPQRLLGRDVFWWAIRSGLVALPDPSGSPRRPSGRGAAAGLAFQRVRAAGKLLHKRREREAIGSRGFVIGTSWEDVERAGVVLRPRAVSASGGTLGFADGTTAEVAGVIWATGYRADYSWLDVPGSVVDGTVQHTGGITPVPGLAFLGLDRQRGRSSEWLGFVGDDAAWLAEQLQPAVAVAPVA
jgi:putative flavoprotein involved in K+ transport